MHQFYHPSSEPNWVDSDWIRVNTRFDPESTSVEELADNGYFEEKVVDPDTANYSAFLYVYRWSNTIAYPYCVREVFEYQPLPLDQAKKWMLKTYPDYAAEIEAATSVDELQQILNSIPQT
jgi:hypothetical protein